ncbi:MAG: hypothetical protein H6Q11_1198 [Acidobacteria bacterium]|jgi:hypothetical protein|nr:hypothetical protein [Acidobacteriota bacterium]
MDYREIEETLARLPSVHAVRIIAERDRIREVHVLAAPEKAAKQVVRDVQTLVLARFGLDLDRRLISVVQIGPDRLRPDEDRPVILGVHEIPEGARTTVAVTLRWHGEEYVGTATGPAAPSARLRLVGEAALRATERIIGDEALALDAVGAPAVGMNRVIVVVVVGTGPRGEGITVGSALSKGDDAECTVRAVLDALNRRIGRPD